MAIMIRPNGDATHITPQAGEGRPFTARELAMMVTPGENGYLEVVHIPPGPDETDSRVMWLHEEGKFRGLPLNAKATEMVRHVIRPDDVIVGTVVVASAAESGFGQDEEECCEAIGPRGRCELPDGHDGHHMVGTSGTYIEWDGPTGE